MLNAGADPEDVRAQLLASPAFAQATGGTDDGFIIGAYVAAMGRAPTPAEWTDGVGLLRQGFSRDEVARSLLATPEARTTTVARLYVRDLGRRAGSTP